MENNMAAPSHRGPRSIKLLSTTRGTGVLRAAGAEVEVRYQLDTYEEKFRRTVSGSLEGDISFAEDRAAGVLTLASGETVDVLLIKPDEDGADFQAAPA
jgi:hypothetical protein